MIDTVNLLDALGFTIHPDKSKFIPSQVLIFLGFVINSVTMKVRLTDERRAAIKEACIKLIRKESHTIREVVRVTGLMTASFPMANYGPLHFRDLEHQPRSQGCIRTTLAQSNDSSILIGRQFLYRTLTNS